MTEASVQAIESMLKDEATPPQQLKPLLQKLKQARAGFAEINTAIAKTQDQLQRLLSERDKAEGAGAMLLEIISESLPNAEVKE